MGLISSSLCHKYEEMGYFDNDNSEELEKLKKENEKLKQKVKDLEAKLNVKKV